MNLFLLSKKIWVILIAALVSISYVLFLVLWLGKLYKSHTFPSMPFGTHHYRYNDDSIRPTIGTADHLDRETKIFYDQWKKKYLGTGQCGQGRYYVKVKTAKKIMFFEDTTEMLSEGHGYGMIILAYMAGYDKQAQYYFDGMVKMFQDHPAMGGSSLMAWKQGKGCKDLETHSASDGDLDIAYALLLADKQWGSDGSINYKKEAQKVITAVLEKEVQQKDKYIFVSSGVHPQSEFFGTVRLSDLMVGHFRSFYRFDLNPIWNDIINKSYSLFEKLQTNFSPQYGLFPDFIVNVNTPFPKPASLKYHSTSMVNKHIESENDNQFYYNSSRVPLRLGLDYLIAGDNRAKRILIKLNDGMIQLTSGLPVRIRDGYYLDGRYLGENHAIAFVAPLGVSAMIDSKYQAWLNEIWDHMVKMKIDESDYYGNTLKLISMIIISGNWWAP